MYSEMLYSVNRNYSGSFSRKDSIIIYEDVHFSVRLYLNDERISYWKHHTVFICNIFHYLTDHFTSIKSTLLAFLKSTIKQQGKQSFQ